MNPPVMNISVANGGPPPMNLQMGPPNENQQGPRRPNFVQDLPPLPSIFSKPQELQPRTPGGLRLETPGSINFGGFEDFVDENAFQNAMNIKLDNNPRGSITTTITNSQEHRHSLGNGPFGNTGPGSENNNHISLGRMPLNTGLKNRIPPPVNLNINSDIMQDEEEEIPEKGPQKPPRLSMSPNLQLDVQRLGFGGEGGKKKFFGGRDCVTPTDTLSKKNMMLNLEMFKRTSDQLNGAQAAYPKRPMMGENKNGLPKERQRRPSLAKIAASQRRSCRQLPIHKSNTKKEKRVSFNASDLCSIHQYDSEDQYYKRSEFYHHQKFKHPLADDNQVASPNID